VAADGFHPRARLILSHLQVSSPKENPSRFASFTQSGETKGTRGTRSFLQPPQPGQRLKDPERQKANY
jgi:hypothetical protein